MLVEKINAIRLIQTQNHRTYIIMEMIFVETQEFLGYLQLQ